MNSCRINRVSRPQVLSAEVPSVDLCLNHSIVRRQFSDSGMWFGCCTRELLKTLLALFILLHKQTSGGTLDFKSPFFLLLPRRKKFLYAYCFRLVFQNDTLVPKTGELSTSLMMHCSLSTQFLHFMIKIKHLKYVLVRWVGERTKCWRGTFK